MPALFSASAAELRAHLGHYAAALEAKKPGLLEKDAWVHVDLPAALRTREPPHLTKDDLIKLAEWKVTKEKNRPGFVSRIQTGNSEAAVKAATEKGSAKLKVGLLKEAYQEICELHGVGPATASAILAAAAPDKAAFMSDEALEDVVGSRKYVLNEGLELSQKLMKRAAELRKEEEATEKHKAAADAVEGKTAKQKLEAFISQPWTANLLQLAIWTATRQAGAGEAKKAAPSKAAGGAGKAAEPEAEEAKLSGKKRGAAGGGAGGAAVGTKKKR